MVEVLIVIMGIIFALAFFIEKVTNFMKQLRSSVPTKFGKGFEAKLSVAPVNKKSEVSASNTNFTTNDTYD